MERYKEELRAKYPDGLPADEETVLGDLVNQIEFATLAKRHCRKYLCYRTPDMGKGTFVTTQEPYSREQAEALRKRYPDIEILNETYKTGL
jgi:hypothetical protein